MSLTVIAPLLGDYHCTDPTRDSTFAASVLKTMYGIDAAGENDPFIEAVDAGLEGQIQGMVAGKFLVEYLPFLRYIPTWVPGARAQRLFSKWQVAGNRLKELPYDALKASLVSSIWIYLVLAIRCSLTMCRRAGTGRGGASSCYCKDDRAAG